RPLQPLDNPHGEPHSYGKANCSKPLYLMFRAAELPGQRLPGQSAFLPPRVQRFGQGWEVPAKALVATNDRQYGSGSGGGWRDKEALRSAAEPSEDEERVLAGAVAALRNAGQRRCADRVIPAALVEQIGLIPNLGCDPLPTEPAIEALCLHRREQTER